MEAPTFQVHEVVVEIRIEASPERVWRALVHETGSWWHKDFYMGSAPRAFVIEPRLGGRMYEDWGDGQGLVWATVVGLRENELLQLSGELFMDGGGPARLQEKIELTAEGDVTLLRMRESLFGHASEKTRNSLQQGWTFLFGDCLKPFVETGAVNTADFGS